jgi:hypothetical protein
MSVLSWGSIAAYCAFSNFVFYQQLLAKRCRGSNQQLRFALSTSALLATLTGIIYLVYYGWSEAWWAPIVIFIIGLASAVVGLMLESAVGIFALGLSAFAGWPVCAYLMFTLMPRAPQFLRLR